MKVLILKYGFVVVLISFLALAHVQNQFEVFKEPKLKKPLSLTEKTPFSLEDWMSTSFQGNASAYERDHFGFFNSILMSYNQVEFSVFNKAHARKVQIGEEGYLYEEAYIDAYYGRDLLPDSVLRSRMQKLVEVRNGLDSLGVRLMILLAPGKGSFYPEYIPDHLREAYVPDKTNLSVYREALEQNGVAVLDMNKWFVERKESSEYPLISQTGIHWSYYGMLKTIDTLIHFSEDYLRCDLPDIQFNDIEVATKPRFTDGDVEFGMNLMQIINGQELAYPSFNFEEGNFDRVKMLMVGDSYGLGLYKRGLFHKSFSDGQFWFYNKMAYRHGHEKRKLGYVDWMEEVKTSELIVLLATDATLPEFPWKFIDIAHEELNPLHPAYRKKTLRIREIIKLLKEDTSAITKLKLKCVEKDITLKVALKLEADYLYWSESQ